MSTWETRGEVLPLLCRCFYTTVVFMSSCLFNNTTFYPSLYSYCMYAYVLEPPPPPTLRQIEWVWFGRSLWPLASICPCTSDLRHFFWDLCIVINCVIDISSYMHAKLGYALCSVTRMPDHCHTTFFLANCQLRDGCGWSDHRLSCHALDNKTILMP